jgi:hypothetical protein
MFSSELFHLMADEREREVRHLLKVRALLAGPRRDRSVVAAPPAERRARGR